MCTIELLSNPINNAVSDGLVSPGRFPRIRCTAATLHSIWWLYLLQHLVHCDWLPFVILFTKDDIMPKKSERHLVCQSLLMSKGSRLWWFGHLFQRPWRFSRFASHLSWDDKCMSCVRCLQADVACCEVTHTQTQTRTILQIQNCLFRTETIKLSWDDCRSNWKQAWRRSFWFMLSFAMFYSSTMS